MNEKLLVCSGLTKLFGTKQALTGVDLTVGSGKIVGLLGPNGSGKTTFLKLINGLIQPTGGSVLIDGQAPGVYTHSITSYLPDRMFLNDWMKVIDLIRFFDDFYSDFDFPKAMDMLQSLGLSSSERLKTLSKGTKEKVQLIVTMARKAKLYLLDEPIGGVDPAARDYILNTILTNYSEDSTVIISTHLIADIERVLDEIVFLKNGEMTLYDTVDNIREREGKSVDQLFREVFAC
ncbi:MAG: ABC transporter ATP-binding protein [Oscillospiraceae bacterium]|jgi:ABC-2 type transport system ATP-binding protein|nr:ABC transporter ATP-binding protein [Oscillospiraceae bacterium]